MANWTEVLQEGIQYERTGNFGLALRCFAQVIEGSNDPLLISEAHRRSGDCYRSQCKWDEAITSAQTAGQIAREHESPDHVAQALNMEGTVLLFQGKLEEAEALFTEAKRIGSSHAVKADTLMNLGVTAAHGNEVEVAKHMFALALEQYRKADILRGQAQALTNLGRAAIDTGDLEEAGRWLREALAVSEELGDLANLGVVHYNYAEVLLGQKRYVEANAKLRSAIEYFSPSGNTYRMIECYRILGDICVAQGEVSTALSMYETGLELAEPLSADREIFHLSNRIRKQKNELYAQQATLKPAM